MGDVDTSGLGDVLQVGPWDIALLVSFVGVVVYWIVNKKLQADSSPIHKIDLTTPSTGLSSAHVENVGFLANMKKTGKSHLLKLLNEFIVSHRDKL